MFGPLVGAEHQAVALLTQIAFKALIAQDRHFRQALTLALDHFRHGISDPVLVNDRNCRNVEPQHGSGLAGIISCRRDDMLADDIALIGLHLPLTAWQALETFDLGVEIDLGAIVARTFGERHGDIGRRNMAILGVIERAQHIMVVFKQRPQFTGACRGNQFGAHALHFGNTHIALVFVKAVARVGNTQLAAFVPADMLTSQALRKSQWTC